MYTLKDEIQQLLLRDLDQVYQEILSYDDEESIWLSLEGTNNSGGVLARHICGNLNHFVGHILGDTGYKRDREHEFEGDSILRSDLLQLIRDTKHTIYQTLETLEDTDLHKKYPEVVFGYPMSTRYFLMHLISHLSRHLGQINYHRRYYNEIANEAVVVPIDSFNQTL